MRDIKNYNDKRQLNGYQEWYLPSGILKIRGNARNAVSIRYLEWHSNKQTKYYII